MRTIKVNIPIYIPIFLARLVAWPLLLYRWFKYGYSFRIIKLTNDKIALVENADYHEINSFKWWARKSDATFYAESTTKLYGGKKIAMHQYVMGKMEGLVIDHINHNGLDNRKSNLRFVTCKQNGWNTRKARGKYTSKYKGVHWHKSMGKWVAAIRNNGKRKQLGVFDSEIEAAKVYNIAAKKHRGEFAVLNKV